MPPAAKNDASPIVLLHGDDDLAVKSRAKALYSKWCAELGGMDHEIIDASASNSADSLKALAKLREALQTLPFFGGGKAVWLRDCNFLSDDRILAAAAVTETLAEIAGELKDFSWQNVRLLISATKVDKRKTFFKTVEKIGAVESYAGLSADDRDWAQQADLVAQREIRAHGKDISDDALADFVARIGPNSRLLVNEAEKLCTFVGTRADIKLADVQAVCLQNRTSRAFALGDALGDRDLPGLLRRLDEELWEIRAKIDKDKSAIGLLYGLISKVRVMVLLKEMIREGWLKSGASYDQLKRQLENIPADALPKEKKHNPAAMHPFVIFNTLKQVKNYTQAELVRAMDLLLQCNRQLVGSGLDDALILQQTLVKIVARAEAASPAK